MQEFDITKKMLALEIKHESNLELAKNIEGLTDKSLAWNQSEITRQIINYKDKCEDELIERSNILIELAYLLEKENKTFTEFSERLCEMKYSFDMQDNNS